ncbi:MAG: adenylate/guanylate cyclase domain-containing protein [Cellulomonadaceae bacterium]|jgi:adenylate cyclase|nr:adenylate/guanylate cyclase domain-containing protein [Cellulomonadaceae bacterium]
MPKQLSDADIDVAFARLMVNGGACADLVCTHDLTIDRLDDISEHIEQGTLGGQQDLTIAELAQRAGLTQEQTEKFWIWLGEPLDAIRSARYSDIDVTALRTFKALWEEEHLPEEVQRDMVHALGSNLDRLAMWQVSGIMEALRMRGLASADTVRIATAREVPHFMRIMYPLAGYVWTRKCASATRHLTVDMLASPFAPDDTSEMPYHTAVGFADIVGFTQHTLTLSPRQVSEYVATFEGWARDLVATHNCHTVKMLGDAVFFIADSIKDGAECALALTEGAQATIGSDVRAGLVWGRSLARAGDVYGPAVNLASRLTECAGPGGLVVDPATAAALAPLGYTLHRQPTTDLQGIGACSPVAVSRAQTPSAL